MQETPRIVGAVVADACVQRASPPAQKPAAVASMDGAPKGAGR